MAGMSSSDSEYDVPLNLVALIDILTNILFFLMVGFAETSTYEGLGKIHLPDSNANSELAVSVEVAISNEELIVEKQPVAKVVNGKIVAALEGDKIVPLYDRLNQLRAVHQQSTQGLSKDDDVVFLLADREVPFTLLAPIMKTAAMAGYPNFRFAVTKTSD
jgi:biopolymer transport protein ExbD